ncbi:MULTISPECIES: hypothetical protein [Treponema]|uniref:hypothetical protein n=1 Tax=Treponema TaxID=157 RepID=UPI0002B59EB3|nr:MULTISPECIES: hypothetical protein [Treponema]EMB47319.1 hypothetical protein HMPREF9729_00788 [Treponema denticola ASLM]EMD55664.1 hypothetical protein HMPREF9728_02563 [Treponema denticola US-Trep]UTD09047.1 hypothetical protein HYB91_00405 [Treponema sp. B152]
MKKYIFICMIFAFINSAQAQDSFFDDSDFNDESANSETGQSLSSNFEFSGFAALGIRFYPHPDLKRAEAVPNFGINLKHSSSKTEIDSHFKFNMRTILEYPLDFIDECTMRAYLGDFVLSTGKMKLVWGRGDMLHVLDVFNANDFTDFTIPSYIDRRIGEPMIHLAYNAPIALRLEAAWTPLMTPDRVSLKGPWVPSQIDEAKQKLSNTLFDGTLLDLFPSQKIENIMYTTIKDTLTAITSPPANITVNFPVLSDEEIDQISSQFNSLQKPVIKAILKSLSGKPITIDISGTLTEDKINEIAEKESKKYAKFIIEEFKTSLQKAGTIIQNFDLNPFIKIGMNSFLPDMNQIKYGQYGLRLSGSLGPTDMACQYYFGHYKTPSIDVSAMVEKAMSGGNIRDCVYYDPIHIFGMDFGAAIFMFNFRSEAAYYMSYDFKGNNPAVHNNSIQWVLGFDVDIPLNNINLNIQDIGSYILGFKNVKENNKNGFIDMDWNKAEKASNNKLVVNISDSWLHENLSDSITIIWGIEHHDAVIMPKIKYRIKDEFYVEGTGAYIYAKDKKSEFASWKNNHFVQLSFEYHF